MLKFVKSILARVRINFFYKRLITVLSLDILVKASSFILLPIYLRLMTQNEYGVYNYILSIVYSFSVFLNLGLFIPQSKLYHDYSDMKQRGYLFYNVNMMLLAGIVILVIPVYIFKLDYAIVAFLFKNPVNYSAYRIWMLLMTISSLFSYMLSNFLYTSERIRVMNRYSLSRIIFINLVSVLALFALRGHDAILVRLVVTTMSELILLTLFYLFYIKEMTIGINVQLMKKCLRMGLPIMVSSVFGMIINFGDKFFLEKNVNYQQLSIYYLAVSFASIISLLSNSLQNVWLPIFFKEKDLKENIRKTNKMIYRLIWVLVALSVAIFFGVVVCLATNFIPRVYTRVIPVLPIMLAGQVVVCIALLYSNYFTYFEKTSIIFWTGLVISMMSIGLNIILIPKWHIYGAATTIFIANSCYLVVYYIFIQVLKRKHFRLSVQVQKEICSQTVSIADE
jgi:O-antigen/teichoic acid export membrane protein